MRRHSEPPRDLLNRKLAALDELKGRLIAIEVVYIDTGVRVHNAVVAIDKAIQIAAKRPLASKEVNELAEELYSLRTYLMEIRKEYPEVKGEFDPTIGVINYLLEPTEKAS